MPKSYQWGWWVGGWPKIFYVSPLHFENGASSKSDDFLAKDGGLLHFLPLAVHLNFLEWTILDNSYFLNFFVGTLLHAEKLWVVVVVGSGLQD